MAPQTEPLVMAADVTVIANWTTCVIALDHLYLLQGSKVVPRNILNPNVPIG